jgi:uncharacterized membrane protein
MDNNYAHNSWFSVFVGILSIVLPVIVYLSETLDIVNLNRDSFLAFMFGFSMLSGVLALIGMIVGLKSPIKNNLVQNGIGLCIIGLICFPFYIWLSWILSR